MLRFLPGIAGAAGAFIVLKLITPIESVALWLEVLIFAVAYVAIAVVVDGAMARYGRNR